MASAKFAKERAHYYDHLASILEASAGEIKPLAIFQRDAERYPGMARGVLSAWWAQRFMENGGDIAEAWAGTLPDDEVSMIRVSQGAGDGALVAVLLNVARIAHLSDRIRGEVTTLMLAAIIGMLISVLMLTIFPIFSASKLAEIFVALPKEEWGQKGKAWRNWADGVKAYGPFVLAAFALALSWLIWSFSNFVGTTRDWLDRKTILYRMLRDLKGALFLATMSTLMQRRGNVTHTLTDSLTTLAQGARSAWFRWRIREIAARVETSGAVNADVFHTAMLSDEMFYFLRDMQEARGMSEAFAQTGQYVEKTIVEAIVRRMSVYRWAVLLVGVACLIGVMGYQMAVIDDMRKAMLLYYSSR